MNGQRTSSLQGKKVWWCMRVIQSCRRMCFCVGLSNQSQFNFDLFEHVNQTHLDSGGFLASVPQLLSSKDLVHLRVDVEGKS